MPATSPTDTPIVVRPIVPDELERILLRCWPDRATIDRLFMEQGTIGMAAWDGDLCVGQLHGYRVTFPNLRNDCWPDWSAPDDAWRTRLAGLGFTGAAWCHACIHVGRTMETVASDLPDARYWHRGIGTALCRASVEWARAQGYQAVFAWGAPDGLTEFMRWAGHLPWTTYAKLGFRARPATAQEIDQLPGWLRGEIHEPIASEIRNAFTTRAAHDLLERLMVLDLHHTSAELSA